MNNIEIKIGRKIFKMSFRKDDINKMMQAWWEFFNAYRAATGGISARTWKYPKVKINGLVVAKVAPNGRWHE